MEVLVSDKTGRTGKEARMKPAPFVECSVCGREFGSKSIVIHERQCLQKLRRTEVDPADASNGETLPPSRKKNSRSSKPSAAVVNNFFVTPFGKVAEENGGGGINAIASSDSDGRNRLPKLVSHHQTQTQRSNGHSVANGSTKDRPSTVTLSRPKILNLDFIQYDMSLTRIDNTNSNSTVVKIKTVTSQPSMSQPQPQPQQVPSPYQYSQTQFSVTGASPIKFKSRSTGRINGRHDMTNMMDDSGGGGDETVNGSKFPSVMSPPPPINESNRMTTSYRRPVQERDRIKLPDSNSLFSTFSTMLGDPDPNRPFDPFKRSSLIQRSPTTTSTIADLHLRNPNMTMSSNNAQLSYFTTDEDDDDVVVDERDDVETVERMSFPTKIRMTKANFHHDRPPSRVRSRRTAAPAAAKCRRARPRSSTTVHCSFCTSYSYNDLTQDQDQEQEPEGQEGQLPSSSSAWQPSSTQGTHAHGAHGEERDHANINHNDDDDEVRLTQSESEPLEPTPSSVNVNPSMPEFETDGHETKEQNQQHKHKQKQFPSTSSVTVTKLPPINLHIQVRQEAKPGEGVSRGVTATARQTTTTLEFIDQDYQRRRTASASPSAAKNQQRRAKRKSNEMDDELVVLKHPPLRMASKSSTSVCNLSMKIKEESKKGGRKVFRSTHSIILPEVHGWTKMSGRAEDDKNEEPDDSQSNTHVQAGGSDDEPVTHTRFISRRVVSSEDGEEFYETAASGDSGPPTTGATSPSEHYNENSQSGDGDEDSDDESEFEVEEAETNTDTDADAHTESSVNESEGNELPKLYAKESGAKSAACHQTTSAPSLLQTVRQVANISKLKLKSKTSTNVELLPGYLRPESSKIALTSVVDAAAAGDEAKPEERGDTKSIESSGGLDNASMAATDQSSQNTKEPYQSTDEYLDYYNLLNDNKHLQKDEYPSSYTSSPTSGSAHRLTMYETESRDTMNELTQLVQGQLKSQKAEVETGARRKRSKPAVAAMSGLISSPVTAENSRLVNPFRKVKDWLHDSAIADFNVERLEVVSSVEPIWLGAAAACGDADAGNQIRPATAPPGANGVPTITDRSTIGTSATGRFQDRQESLPLPPRPATALPASAPTVDVSKKTSQAQPKRNHVASEVPNIIEGLMKAVFRVREETRLREAEEDSGACQTTPTTTTRVYKFKDHMTVRVGQPSSRPATASPTASAPFSMKPKQMPSKTKKKKSALSPKSKSPPLQGTKTQTVCHVNSPLVPKKSAQKKIRPKAAKPKPEAEVSKASTAQAPQPRPVTSPLPHHPGSPYLAGSPFATQKPPPSPMWSNAKRATGKSQRPLTPMAKPKPFNPNPSSPPPFLVRPKSASASAKTPNSPLISEKLSPKLKKKKLHSANKSCQFPEKRSAFTQSSPAKSLKADATCLSGVGVGVGDKKGWKSILKPATGKQAKLQEVVHKVSRDRVDAIAATVAQSQTATPAPVITSATAIGGKSVQFKELHDRFSPTQKELRQAHGLPEEVKEECISCSPTKVCFHKSENETHEIYQFHRPQSPCPSLTLPEVDSSPIAYTLLMPKMLSSREPSPVSISAGASGQGEAAGIDVNIIVRREAADGQFPPVETVVPEYLQEWMYLVVDEPRTASAAGTTFETETPRTRSSMRDTHIDSDDSRPEFSPVKKSSLQLPVPSFRRPVDSADIGLDLELVARSEAYVSEEVKKLMKIQLKRKYGENKMFAYC